MIYLAIISAIFIWFCGISYGHWKGYMKGYEQGSSHKDLRNYTYLVEIEDEPEFKEHELN